MDSGAVTCERQDDKLTFRIIGSFNYAIGSELKKLANRQSKASEYIIDLRAVTYINSSAFGVMLILREMFGADEDNLSLVNASPEIKKMLNVVKFETIFKVV
jgi:HptB-dependent secretion and biofilm anti anti-sigma factor